MDDRTFVITARLDDVSAALLTSMRKRYFPPTRNFLDAHLTLFHKIPPDGIAVLAGAAALDAPRMFEVEMGEPHSLGRGVAIRVESPPLIALRDRLAAGLRDLLSAQDRQPFRPHVTIQNKVSAEEARRSLIRICREWHPRSARVEGIDVWEYLGGPWSLHARIPFDPEG